MENLKVAVWMFPILFVFHDFEEILLMKLWLGRNREYLHGRLPRLAGRIYPHFDKLTTASFGFGVAEEYLVILAVSFAAFFTGRYELWLGLFIAFVLHLAIHCVQALVVGKYVPALATSLVCLPASMYILFSVMGQFTVGNTVLYSLIGLAAMGANLAGVHRAMEWVEAKLGTEA